MQDTQRRLLTTADAARQIGVSSETIRVWENAGKLRAIRTASGIRLFDPDDVARAAREYAAIAETRNCHR